MKLKYLILLLCTAFFAGCSGDDGNGGTDQEKPVINMTITDGFPISCTTVTRGSVIPFKALFTDNQLLGGYSVNIHNNFDHHSHDTEVDECTMDPIKVPVNPWAETFTYTIPTDRSEYLAEQQIIIPSDIDTGDYHFMIQLTDAQGWATMRGISFKIVE